MMAVRSRGAYPVQLFLVNWSGTARLTNKFGSLAQLVERHVYTVDVIGSIPVGPTNGERPACR